MPEAPHTPHGSHCSAVAAALQDNAAAWLLLALELFPGLTHLHLNHNNFSGQPNTPLILSRQTSSASIRQGGHYLWGFLGKGFCWVGFSV